MPPRRKVTTVALVAVLAVGLQARAESSEEHDPALPDTSDRVAQVSAARVHPPKKRSQSRVEDKLPTPPVGYVDRFKNWVRDHDFLLGFDAAFYNQYASHVRKEDSHNAATIAWQLFTSRELLEGKHGSLHVALTLLGTIALDYDPNDDPLFVRVGSISVPNGNIYPNEIAVDELYLHYVTEGSKWTLDIGKIDMSYFFDTNRVANDAFSQFMSFTLENNASIPFPIYGGFGALGRWNPNDDIYVMIGAGDATSNERIPWGRVGDGAWWQLLEVGAHVDFHTLGTGNYRLTGWHSNNGPGNGFGIGLNIDQNLGLDWLIGFFRTGLGNRNQTAVKATVSGGVSFAHPFGRANDGAGIGFSWGSPDIGGRDEGFFEAYYRLSFNEYLSISPDLQIVFPPAYNRDANVSVIGGVRVLWRL